MELFLSIIAIILIIIGIIGVFLPVLPGILLSYSGLLLYHFFGYGGISSTWLIIFGILTFLTLFLDYIIPLKTTRKYGGTNWGNIGGFIGMLIGFWIPIPLGFLIGMLVGVFIGEYLFCQKTHTAFKAAYGTLIGFLYSTIFSFFVGIAMLIVQVYYFISKLFFA